MPKKSILRIRTQIGVVLITGYGCKKVQKGKRKTRTNKKQSIQVSNNGLSLFFNELLTHRAHSMSHTHPLVAKGGIPQNSPPQKISAFVGQGVGGWEGKQDIKLNCGGLAFLNAA